MNQMKPIDIIVIGTIIAGLMSLMWMLRYWPFN